MCCGPGTICFEMMKGVPAAFVTLIIGAIAGAITWRQYKVAQAKLKLDLFERRYAIFHKVWEICSETFGHGASSVKFGELGLSTPFTSFRPEAAFLFGKEIEAYIDELSKNWAQLRALEALPLRVAATNVQPTPSLQEYFLEQANGGVKDRFAPFLDFANWK
jgi:hypothetical protein